jgi:hypothetical protein
MALVMVETIAAAAAAAVISAGSAAAMSAARRSGETRDAVLMLRAQVESLDSRLSAQLTESTTQYGRLYRRVEHLDSRVTALELGHVDRRRIRDDETE